jgi:hypothetical protein
MQMHKITGNALLAAGALMAFSPTASHAQGCVAAHGSGVCMLHGDHGVGMSDDDSKWEGSLGYRFLNSGRHFVGDQEQVQREQQHSQVINTSNFIDANLTYYITPRYNATLTVPFVIHDRSQTYVLNGTRTRFHTQAQGLSDVRLAAHAWILDPTSPSKWNILVGLGVDAPTGQDDAKDIFPVVVNNVLTAQERTVDQSIQPGDGGWGITLDVYAYYQITERITAYANGAYTITPEETSHVPTFRNNPREAIMSIADSYLGRVGAEFTILPKYGLTFSLGGRIEGVPVYDLIGGSEWFRRPGYSISLEPGVMANLHGWKIGVYTPIALYNNRERSVPDIETGGHGDAAFADYQVLFSIAHSI